MTPLRWLPALVVALLVAACAPLPAGRGQGALWQPSPNFDQRRPNFVILHQTGSDSARRALATLSDPLRKVSAHYLIARDGALVQLVAEGDRAWHAGQSWWGGNTDLNSASIGIELDNRGDEPFADAQIDTLLVLLDELRARYRIPAANFLAHGDVAPGRKVDPSRQFPWRRLAAAGFGLWCENPPAAAPAPFDATLALHAFGYAVAPDAAAARAAFRRHFSAAGAEAGNAGDETGVAAADSELSPTEQALLHCLLQTRAQQASPTPPE